MYKTYMSNKKINGKQIADSAKMISNIINI